MGKVEPRTLPGFMELLPSEQVQFNRLKNIIQKTYEKYGFLPIDTPVIESSQVLLAKAGGETEKQIYRFNKGDNDLSLRFDLTVPLAKYVAKNVNDLTFPFRRYQIGKVYRGEKVQRGRYREFYQCDIDIIDNENLNIINDAEIPSIIYSIFKEMDFGKFTIRINNRKVLSGFFDALGLNDKLVDILRIIDKIDKAGQEKVVLMLKELEIDDEKINRIIEFIQTKENVVEYLKSLNLENDLLKTGIEELEIVEKYMNSFGVPKEYYMIDLSIARGLDYYTGTVYETIIDEYPQVGSICSGGRYDNLAEFYTDKKLPGVGISIGLTRLFFVLNEYNLIKTDEKKSIAEYLIIPMLDDLSYPIDVATKLRNSGKNVEIYFDNKSMKKKMNYANKQNVPYVIIIGEDEVSANKVMLKNMTTGEQSLKAVEEI